ncbi:MAG TPA: carbohydrate-binding protein [Chitinophagaceae bacterium]|nr:carbohydrate-binding protein [Chitinophagaceae bacterium]
MPGILSFINDKFDGMMIKYLFVTICLVSLAACKTVSVTRQGKPWRDTLQSIPGRIECELYDQGGEGTAYHDTDNINNGSGKLNPANGSFLNEFRMQEGVDISYTKPGNIDNNPFNKTMPELNQLYLGWTAPGEWVNYTVMVNQTAMYRVDIMYTANADAAISLDIDGRQAAGELKISSTYDARDTVAWRQWHHWNKTGPLTVINMKKGIHLLTLHITVRGNMNFDYLEFKKA